MFQIQLTQQIAAPIETVFDVAADLPRAAEHLRSIEKIELLTEGPVRVGTRWRETRRMMGHTATETLEITAFDRPHGYTVGCDSCGSYFETTFRVAPDSAGTKVTLDVRCEARSLMARLLSPIGNLLFGKAMRQCMRDDLDDIRRVSEAKRHVL